MLEEGPLHEAPQIIKNGKEYLNENVYNHYQNDPGYSHEFRTRYLDIIDSASESTDLRSSKENLAALIKEIQKQLQTDNSIRPGTSHLDVSPLLNECTFLYFQIDRNLEKEKSSAS